MNYYLGIDGGGTKTAYLLVDEEGNEVFHHETEGISYRQYVIDTVVERVKDTVFTLFEQHGLHVHDLKSTVIGLPCYGEDKKSDQIIRDRFEEENISGKLKLVNDVEVAAAGALCGKPGIHLVCGTGSIAISEDKFGNTQRAGGWSEIFSDEGAGTWLGKKAIEIFTKQADGRVTKGRLYSLFHEIFLYEDDFDLMTFIEENYASRKDLASLQKILSQAAKEGDPSCIRAYEDAAYELSLMIKALKERSLLEEPVTVTCTGGIFNNGELIMEPLRKYTERDSVVFEKSICSPSQGAALMAIRETSEENYRTVLKKWSEK